MSDLIDRESLLNIVGKMPLNWEYGQAVSDIYDIILKQPTVEAKHVEWFPMSENPQNEDSYIVAWLPAYIDEKGETFQLPCPYHHFYMIADYYEDEEEWSYRLPTAYKEAILLAWMPLPTPYNADMRKKVE